MELPTVLMIFFLGISLIPSVEANMGSVFFATLGGICSLIILVLDVVAIFELFTKGHHDCCGKCVWTLVIFFFPIGGLILYCCCGRSNIGHESV
ncbi:unnamed protein product [Adineta ricciae]|uniref:Cardiolipin synthase N-terminal domain-containing protein n=1 Tax=Adineta ricciae TaxID=249248 RepID=A0A816GTD5_ADIRI|nr:unnamed protein product [Adineta ricciae]